MAPPPEAEGPDPAALPRGPEAPPIPEALRRPVDHPRAAEILGRPKTDDGDTARMMKGWAIAMNFAFAVMGMALLGYALQRWVWPASAPWPLMVGLAIGLVGGFVQFIRQALAANR